MSDVRIFDTRIARGLWLALALAGAAAVVEAAEKPDASLLYLQQLDQRIADISWRIVAANASLCPRRTNALGISLHDAVQYAPSYRQAAVDTFGFGDGLPAILAVAHSGPADIAGLRPGDRIAAIDGIALPPTVITPTAKEAYEPVATVMTRLEQLPADRPARLDIRRGSSAMTIQVRPVTTCRSRVEVVPGSPINASSNGDVVQIYGKLALWTKSDDELAIVIAHELAHNILDHNRRIDREKIGTGFLASLGSDGRKLRDMEREADRYGLFLAARAGYDYRIAPDFWRRLSATTGLGAVWGTTHPSSSSRAAFNRQAVAEIDRQKAASAVLAP